MKTFGGAGVIRTDRTGMPAGELLARRLGIASPQVAEGLSRWLCDARSHAAGSELCPAETQLPSPLLVASGWVGEVCQLPDGRRQFVALRLPGDVIGLGETPQPFSTVALTEVETVDAGKLVARLREPSPALAPLRLAWARAREAELRQLTDHMVRLGRLTALERTAHLILELHERLAKTGLAAPQSFHLPLTQEVLGDVLGLSIVHVNRTLQHLRRDGLASRRSGIITISDRATLAALASPAPAQPCHPKSDARVTLA